MLKRAELKMSSFRLTAEHIRKLDRIARDLSKQVGTPMGKTDAVRHLIDHYQPRSNP